MIGIDTCSWSKIILLINQGWKELIEECLENIQFFITRPVERELLYFYPDYTNLWGKGAILPKLNRNIEYYLNKGFDEADASLLEYAEMSQYQLITEDGGMLAENIVGESRIIQLSDFFQRLEELDLINRTEYYHLIRWMGKNQNITKRKEKFLLRALKED